VVHRLPVIVTRLKENGYLARCEEVRAAAVVTVQRFPALGGETLNDYLPHGTVAIGSTGRPLWPLRTGSQIQCKG
jgi:hypothetical protein